MAKAIIRVDYDETLVTPDFMGEHVWELEGVADVRVEEEDY